MIDVSVEGADQLQRVARALKELGDRGLRKELLAGIQRAAKPLPNAVRTNALVSLPRRGGLGARVAASKVSVRTRTGGRDPGVRVVAAGRGLRQLDQGRLRHPVFGNRRVWVTQTVTPGWFSKPLLDAKPAVQREIVRVLENVAREVTRRG